MCIEQQMIRSHRINPDFAVGIVQFSKRPIHFRQGVLHLRDSSRHPLQCIADFREAHMDLLQGIGELQPMGASNLNRAPPESV